MHVALCSLSCQWVITEPSLLGWLRSASPKRLLRLLILGSSIKIPEPVLKGGKSAGFPGVSEDAAFMSYYSKCFQGKTVLWSSPCTFLSILDWLYFRAVAWEQTWCCKYNRSLN